MSGRGPVLHRLPANVPADGAALADHFYRDPADGVRANMVMSLDGAFAVHGRVGPLSSPIDHQLLLALRALADVVLVGAGTARAEGYGPVRLDEHHRRLRSAHRGIDPDAAPPPIAVVTATGNLPPASQLGADQAPALVVTTSRPGTDPRPHIDPGYTDVITTGDGAVDLGAALTALKARGYRRILCEGGPALLTALADADLLDELCLTLSPTVVGPSTELDDTPRTTSAGTGGPVLRSMTLQHTVVDDSLIFLRYTRTASGRARRS